MKEILQKSMNNENKKRNASFFSSFCMCLVILLKGLSSQNPNEREGEKRSAGHVPAGTSFVSCIVPSLWIFRAIKAQMGRKLLLLWVSRSINKGT